MYEYVIISTPCVKGSSRTSDLLSLSDAKTSIFGPHCIKAEIQTYLSLLAAIQRVNGSRRTEGNVASLSLGIHLIPLPNTLS